MHVLLFYNCVLTVVKYTDMLCYVMLPQWFTAELAFVSDDLSNG